MKLSTRFFLKNAINAKMKTSPLRVIIIEFTFIPNSDNPKNNPDTPTKLKLNATDNTTSSIRTNFFSLNITLIRQYPGVKVTKVNPKK